VAAYTDFVNVCDIVVILNGCTEFALWGDASSVWKHSYHSSHGNIHVEIIMDGV